MRYTTMGIHSALLPQVGSGAETRQTLYVAPSVCAIADSERHLGHAIKEEGLWTAYDAVHPDPAQHGFLVLGRFKSLLAAVRAIQSSVVAVLETPVSPATSQSKTYLT